MQNIKKWIQISYLLVAILTWIFFYYLVDMVWDLVELPLPVDWFIMPSQIAAFIAAATVMVVLQRNAKINLFSTEVASELSKVTWPEKKETLMSAGVIAVVIAICAVILFGFDSLWGTIVKIIY